MLVKQFLDTLQKLVISKTFWIGFLICFAVFSRYIFGPDNLLEQIGEKVLQEHTGIDIDFSPELKNSRSPDEAN